MKKIKGHFPTSRPTSRLNWYHQIKHFRKKKRDKPDRFLKANIPFLTQIKWKESQLDPYWICYASPFGG